MSQITTCKIIVQNARNSELLCEYLRDNLDAICAAGIRVKLIKVEAADTDIQQILRRNAISHLPALVSAGNKNIIGRERIRSVFDRRLNQCSRSIERDPRESIYTGDPMTDYYMHGLFDGERGESGQPAPKSEPDDRNEVDYGRRMYDFTQRRDAAQKPPKNYTAPMDASENPIAVRHDDQQQAKQQAKQPRAPQVDPGEYIADYPTDEYDNIGEPGTYTVMPKITERAKKAATATFTGDDGDLDAKMYAAWMGGDS